MRGRDPHQTLKIEILKKVHSSNDKFLLAKLHWGQNDFSFSLHVSPPTRTTAANHITDFLSHLGFLILSSTKPFWELSELTQFLPSF